MQKIIPTLWFDGQARQAAEFYAPLFEGGRINRITHFGKEGVEIHGRPEGSVMTVEFELAGYKLIGLNGGPEFRFSPATSFLVCLETEDKVNALWEKLVEGGTVAMPLQAYDWSRSFGWLNDRFGVSWQVMLGNRADIGQTITPSLLFTGAQHGKAEEAINFYTSIFKGTGIDGIMRHDGRGEDPAGTIMHAQFRLNGETFMAMDSAADHGFGFSEAISFFVSCDDQDEVDHLWRSLSAVPEAEQCGWLKDRFGVSWQIIPSLLPELLQDKDPVRAGKAMRAMLDMKKIDINRLKEATF